jgi:hypothetical protein
MRAVKVLRPAAAPNLSMAKPVTELSLWFVSAPQLELIKTAFRSPLVPSEVTAVRGKTARAYETDVTFQWTAAVQAFSVFILRASAQSAAKSLFRGPIVEGGAGSIAASVDAALYKDVGWLGLLGGDVRGDALSRRIIQRTNPGRRRAGPVTISLNERLLPRDAISVYVDNQPLSDSELLQRYADSLEATWYASHSVIPRLNEMLLAVSPRL